MFNIILPKPCGIFAKNLIQQLIQWYVQQIQFWDVLTECFFLYTTNPIEL